MKVANPFLLFLTLPYIAFANVCTSNTPVTEVSGKPDVSCTHITAQKQIKLEPGFIFKASGTDATNTFSAHIDQGLIYPPTHGLTKNSDGTLSDGGRGFAVGSIPYEYSVSNTGAAVYNIPIECPKGIKGMDPKVSLVYNSQAGDGIMGWGWSLGGISSITRENKNQHFDGKVEGVSFSSEDALALEGQRLLKYANEDGGIWYKTESDDFNKIVAYDIQQWGPKYFKVYTKDGYVMTYGSESGDISGYFMLKQESGHIYNIAWNLTEIVDSNGNQIRYKYNNDSESTEKGTVYRNNRLSQIIYGKNKNTKSGFETIINFQYNKIVSRPIPTYINGCRILFDKCLSSVRIINGGSLKTVYSIKYNTIANKNYITEIGFEKNGGKIGSTKFEWAPTQYEHSYGGLLQLPTGSNFKTLSRSFGDIDGDGLSDLCVVAQFVNRPMPFSVFIYHNVGSAYETLTELHFNSLSDIVTYYFCDDDKDGKDEFFIAYKREGAFDVQIFKWDERYRDLCEQRIKVRHDGDRDNIIPIVGDFYGNGSTQIVSEQVVKDKHGNVTESRFVNTENAPSVIFLPTIGGRCKILVTDVNGNGKSDITVILENGLTYIFEEKNGYFTPLKLTISGVEYGFSSKDDIYQGDFNGDGNTDLLVCSNRSYRSRQWLMYLSDGVGYIRAASTLPLKNNCYYHEQVYVTDINKDGRSDLIVKEDFCDECFDYYFEKNGVVWLPYNVLSSRGRVLISTGTSFEEALVFDTNNFEGANASGFISGLCQEDYLSYCDKASYKLSRHTFSKSIYNDKIINITDGMGQSLVFSYGSMGCRAMDVPTYQYGSKDADDISVLNRCQWDVVKTAQILSEKKILASYEYSYFNACFDRKGKGFIGYLSTLITDTIKHTKTESLYNLNNQYKFVFPVKRVTTTDGELTSETNYEYELNPTTGKGYCLLQKRIKENDYLNDLQTITSFTNYDNYGNVTRKQTQKGSLTIYEDVGYSKSGSWCPHIPSYIKTTRYYGGKSDIDERYMSYNDKGNLTYDSDSQITTRYSDFDTFGHALTTTCSTSGRIKTERVTYTTSGRNIATKTNHLGETTIYEWNDSDGTLSSETDNYGRKTSYIYDNFGKCIETRYHDGRRKVESLLWAGDKSPSGASYLQYSEASGQSPIFVWYTSDGKEICTQKYGFGGHIISVFKEYNIDGTVRRVSEPSFSSTPEMWESEYVYDKHQRPIRIINPTGETKISYNGRVVTTVSPTTTIKQTLCAEGWKESVVINGKSVKYSYYPSGWIKSVTPDGGKTINLEYNKQGNRTKLIDPDAGTVLDSYNAFGDILSSERTISDGRRVKTTYTYNDNGLLVQKNIGGDIIRYEYDGNNRLQRKDYGAVHSVEYKYDGFDRVIETKEIIEGNEHLFKTKYDFYGRVTEEKFPTNYAVTNHYDDYGYLTSQSDNQGNNIYEVQSVDAKGRILSERRNNKVTEYSYDAKNNLTDIHANDVLELQYKYRRDNNLPSSVCDRIAGYRQEYYYDSQNRLKSWPIFTATGGTPIQTNSLKYDDNNNIISRSAFGDCAIEYKNEDHPHAVSSIAGVPDIMPRIDQDISYTKFSKVERIDEGDNHYSITYGADQERVKSVLQTPNGETVRYYMPNYEEVTNPLGTTDKIHYLCGGAVMVERDGQWNLYYCYSDRLGSIVAVTDKSGGIVERYAYTPWGERRDPNDWTKPDNRREFFTNRGFTGHEHLDAFNLIDMGGRVYDPMLGSFLSIDPFIQAPDKWLNYNRYLYCYGNPLLYTDPNGESIIAAITTIGTIIATAIVTASMATVGAVLGAINAYVSIKRSPYADSMSVGAKIGYCALGAVIGAGSSLAGYSISAVAQSVGVFAGVLTGGASGVLTSAVGTAIMYGTLNSINGQSFTSNGFWKQVLFSSVSGFISGAISGGIDGYNRAVELGANPWTRTLNGSIKTYKAPMLKEGVPLGPEDKYCYAYACQYADQGHGNKTAQAFIDAARGAEGADAAKAWSEAYNVNVSSFRPNVNRTWDTWGVMLKKGDELIGNYNEHWMNILEISTAQKYKMFGGVLSSSRYLFSTKVWSPGNGFVNGPTNWDAIFRPTYILK